jgi:hypothetical protein
LDCLAEREHDDIGPHQKWSTGLLFDNIKGGDGGEYGGIDVQNRIDLGGGHGWAGAQNLFWNVQGGKVRSDAPQAAMNWVIGGGGVKTDGKWTTAEPFAWWESFGTVVTPRSIYLQQLQDRLGAGAVNAITLPAQRTGRIWDALAAWAGNGRLEDFIH